MENGRLLISESCDIETFEMFVSLHESQLRIMGVPECKWRILCYKLCESIFDAGDDFIYAQEDSDNHEENENPLRVYTKCSMDPGDENHIYLIDHAWTYTWGNAKRTLEENNNLVERMCSLMNISHADCPLNEVISTILSEIWRYNNSYAVSGENQATSITRCWFIMDEFGSCIRHAENPSFEIVTFFYASEKSMYSLLFPRISIEEGEEVTCGYPRFSITLSQNMQKAIKYPWEPSDLSEVDFIQQEPSDGYFLSGRNEETLPDSSNSGIWRNVPATREIMKVYSEYTDVKEFLTHPLFKLTSDKNEAHVLWLAERVWDYKQLIESCPNFLYISQFPSEQVLINKDLLAILCRRCCKGELYNLDTLKSYPKWLPTTFSLLIELPQFISYFQNREKRNLDNIWICKPFNLARGLEIYITDNLSHIIRLTEIRPMVACKYITDPVLFPVEGVGLVKMDLRFILLLRSTEPLELYVYKRFWLRFANKPFSLNDLEDYEKHFTVMNYSNFPLQQMYCNAFIQKFEEYYESYKWSDIEQRIYDMIKEIFTASTVKEPPSGIGAFQASRAMYGLDIMLQWDRNHDVPAIFPVILEVNWMPDCNRACQYYPEFYNDVFSVLFLGETKGKHVIKL